MVAPVHLSVGVVGVGRAGSVLAAALQAAGHRIVAVHAVSHTSKLRAASLLPQAEVVKVEEVFARADLVLLTVPDDVLPGLVSGAADAGHVRAGQFVAHASGRYGVAVLDPATARGGLPLALHPVMTFAGTANDLGRLTGCTFGVTAPDVLRPVAEALVVEMGGEPVWVAEEQRPLYHAALANASNHLVTLTAMSMDLLADAGVADPGRMLGPLMSATLDNVLRDGDAALTGPVMRGDARTVQRHLDTLAGVSDQAAATYVALARQTADRALASGLLPPERAAALLAVLADDRGGPR
jgi:predicted short-subunit dehydrogenase-like oxidoreductase (DUF2520 family)